MKQTKKKERKKTDGMGSLRVRMCATAPTSRGCATLRFVLLSLSDGCAALPAHTHTHTHTHTYTHKREHTQGPKLSKPQSSGPWHIHHRPIAYTPPSLLTNPRLSSDPH
uniref:Uncharacterized protein n=1 Tax=Lotharella globosa TaxID=91324 RepID=A0A7S4DSZ4_9EUKA|mmetsp:Transcript_21892/g.43982  ORF Transcript_21892/g.43982 Transcript_21892/m.43982 type:complete len:109 (+) Transcript_21892:268-594(+)